MRGVYGACGVCGAVRAQEALGEVRDQLHSRMDSLATIFKEIDKDGNGFIDVAEWTSALTRLGLDVPGLNPKP